MMRLFEGTQFDIPPSCERCNELESNCQCQPLPSVIERVAREKQQLKVFPERRKHGKTITCVKGIHEADVAEMLTALKDKFGCGGTVKDGVVELQGDHAVPAKTLLRELGFKVR